MAELPHEYLYKIRTEGYCKCADDFVEECFKERHKLFMCPMSVREEIHFKRWLIAIAEQLKAGDI